ncbi:nucleocapsid protein [Grapevine emaravirus A]|nr:nucleocapsid protein [Grapevine emaravirus A]
MPPKPNRSSMISKASGSNLKPIGDATIRFGTSGKLKVITLQNVVNGSYPKTADVPKELNIKTADVQKAFRGQQQLESKFNIMDYKTYCNIDAAASYLSQSKELKENLKRKESLRLEVSNENYLIVVPDLTDSSVREFVSFNKACAIMALSILKYTYGYFFDWATMKYVTITPIEEKYPQKTIINRLAGAMGIDSDSPHYWLVVPGAEFLYDAFPAEVIALVLVKLHHRHDINLPDLFTDEDIVSSLTMKMNRRHAITNSNVYSIFENIGIDNIMENYRQLTENIGVSGKAKRNQDVVEGFKLLIAKIQESSK